MDLTDDKLTALWREADKGRKLPPAPYPFGTKGMLAENCYAEADVLTLMTPTPEALRRFAEAVAEECARVCEDLDAQYSRQELPGFILEVAAATIRRHVKGE